MKIGDVFYYRHLQPEPEWLQQLVSSIKKFPDSIFFDQKGNPLKREVKQLDEQLFKRLSAKYGPDVKQNFRTMVPENRFEIDIVLPTKPMTLIEIEKGKLPRLELDIMKIINTIWRFPSRYGFGCIIVPANYIKLNLAGRRFPYPYVTNQLLPLNSPVLDFVNQRNFLMRDFIVIGYIDPRG